MSGKIRRILSFVLVLCMSAALVLAMGVSASAEPVAINKVLTTLSYVPVGMNPVSSISVATSTDGCSISNYYWTDATGSTASGNFTKDDYTVTITVAAFEGYYFTEAVTAYLNNDAVVVSRAADGSSLTFSKTYTPLLWQPTIIKQPYSETIEAGGWVSFAASANYAASCEWYLTSPDGSTTIKCSEIFTKFNEATSSGHDTSTVVLRNLPAEIDGWKAYCRFYGLVGFADTNGAKIKIKNAQPEPTPTPVPEETAPVEEPEEDTTATEEGTAEAEHEHSFALAWSSDENQHWHECECGEKTDAADHNYTWSVSREAKRRRPGEETGVCAACGRFMTRALEYVKEDSKLGKTVLWSALIIIAIGIIILAADAAVQSSRRRRRRRYRNRQNRRY